MAHDLAARISEGSIAVLELVPGERRFHDLSRFVLRGGASRFAAAVLEDEPVRYVLPVGVPGQRLDYGTLLIQRSRCSLVWRTDPARPYLARVMELGPQTVVNQSPVMIRGEVWGRFDLQHAGSAPMTFLVPPVSATALPRMLRRVLVDEPRSTLQHIEADPLPPEVTDGPEPVSTPTPPSAPADTVRLPAAVLDAPPASAPVSQPTPPTGAVFDDLYRPSQRATPQTSAPAGTPTGSTRWTPPAPVPAAPATPARPMAPMPSAPVASAPAASQVEWASAAAPAPTQKLPAVMVGDEVAVVDHEHTPVRRGPLSDTVSGFLTGLIVTLVVGGVIIAAKYFGLLG